MSKNQGPVAAINSDEQEVRERMERGEARRKAFAKWLADEVVDALATLPDKMRCYIEHHFWRAFTAGEKHGRAQLDAILSKGRREA